MMKSLSGRAARIAAVLATVVAGAVLPAASPAQAQGNCNVAGSRAAVNHGTISVNLMRTTNCWYYARLTIDDYLPYVGQTINWKVERQEKTPYGWYVTDTKSASTYSFEGRKDTAKVDGWYPTAWEGDDNHRACYRFNSGSWSCTGWIGI